MFPNPVRRIHTVQGELLRAVEKLRWEAQNNGNINWDDRFEMFITFLSDTFQNESGFPQDRKESIAEDLYRLGHFLPVEQFKDESQFAQLSYIDDDLYNRLVDAVAEYCRLHPKTIPRDIDPNQYR